jgi:anti-sigma factor RsiW
MTCPERDADLLMLAHGEGDVRTRLGTRTHLLRCAACRRRYQDFTTVSDILTRSTRPEAVSVALPRSAVRYAGLRPAVALAVILLVTLLLAAVLLAAQHHSGSVSCKQAATPEQAATPGGGVKTRGPCAPGLPNDHCR